MPKLEVTIQPAVLDWIMQQSSADEAVFPDIVDTLQAWRTGTAKPTFHKVEEISKKTRIPFGYGKASAGDKPSCRIQDNWQQRGSLCKQELIGYD